MVKPNMEKPAAERSDLKYKGVRKRKWGKYVSEIRLPNSREKIWLGSYDTAEKAARAFDAAMFCLRGAAAKFNFPGNPPEIAGGRSMTPLQIQAAAARYANSEPRVEDSGRPASTLMDSSSMSPEETVTTQTESLSPSLSELQTDSELTVNGSISDLFAAIGSDSYESDYSIFPGFDDFGGDFYMPEMPSYDYGEENLEGLIIEDSFLWNF